MTTQRQLNQAAEQLASLLKRHHQKIVFAESCTGGLISATLTRFPSISEYHCGSMVVYRLESKEKWLNVSRETLKKPGPVSQLVARQMAEQVLKNTPEATIATSITGHLGPNAPARQDGLIYVGIATRSATNKKQQPKIIVRRHRLPTFETARQQRNKRQRAAAQFALQQTATILAKNNPQ